MVFIVIFYLIWNVFTNWVRQQVHIIGRGGAKPKTEAEAIAEETHEAMYVLWLEVGALLCNANMLVV